MCIFGGGLKGAEFTGNKHTNIVVHRYELVQKTRMDDPREDLLVVLRVSLECAGLWNVKCCLSSLVLGFF